MKLIEADKVEQVIKDYWKAQVDRLPIPKNIEEHDAYANRLGTILEYNSDLLKEIEALPPAEPDTTTHDSIPAENVRNDGDRTSGDCISRQQTIDALKEKVFHNLSDEFYGTMQVLDESPSVQPEHKTGHWILDRSGAYCCDNCMEPCASYVMMRPRDKFCKMCGSRNEVMG